MSDPTHQVVLDDRDPLDIGDDMSDPQQYRYTVMVMVEATCVIDVMALGAGALLVSARGLWRGMRTTNSFFVGATSVFV